MTSGAVGNGWESPCTEAAAQGVGDDMGKEPVEVRWERFPSVAALAEAKQWLGIQSMLGLAPTIVLPTDSGAKMRLRKASTAESEHRELYRLLGVDEKIMSPKTIWSETGVGK